MPFLSHHLKKELVKTLKNFASEPELNRQDIDNHWLKLNKLQSLSQIQISHINFNDISNPLNECVSIHNRGELTLDISGWQIQAGSPDQAYVFPEDSYLIPNGTLHIDTSGKSIHSFQSKRPIWNNKGDIGVLLNENDIAISRLAYGKEASKKIIITHINIDGEEYRSEGDEYVEISNISSDDVMLSNWCLKAETNNSVFLFPKYTVLEAYSSIRVFTNKASLQPNEFSFNSPTAIWNNHQGGCKLFDYLSNEVSNYYYP